MTASSPRRVCSTTSPRPSRRGPTSRPALPTAVIALRRADALGRQQVLVEVDEDDDAAVAHPLPHRFGAHDDALERRRRGRCDAVTSLTVWPSWAATSRASVVTPTRTRFRFVAPQVRQKFARGSCRSRQVS